MTNKDHPSDGADERRKRAEEILLEKAGPLPEELRTLSPEAMRQMLHEYQVQRVELEMQNDELRRAQKALDASKERYFALYDLAPVGYCTVSEEGLILEANLTAANLLGIPRGARAKWPFSQFIVKEDQDSYYLHRKKLFDTGEQQVSELRMVKRDGTVFWARLEAAAAKDADGAPVSRIMISDITASKKAEEALRESKALTEAIVENVPLMIFLKEAKDLCFVVFNRAGEELLGYDRKELLGKNNLDLFPPEQAAHFMAKDREALDGKIGMLDIPEERIQTAKKGERLLHTRKVCIRGSDGSAKYLWGISEDITERKKAEEVLSDRMRELKIFHDSSRGREERIVELKDEIFALKEKLESARRGTNNGTIDEGRKDEGTKDDG